MADDRIVEAADVKFSEAIEYLRRRLNLSSEEWREIWTEAGGFAPEAADEIGSAVVRDLLEAALEAVENGSTIETFRERYAAIMRDRGWSYHGDSGWHSQLVFRMHTGSAYAAGRWEQAERLAELRPDKKYFWRYVTVGDHRVRPHHKSWHGIVLPQAHAFWKTHFPPNGFNCRCHAQLVTERDIARRGWAVTADDDPRLAIPPDSGWAVNVGLVGSWLSSRKPAVTPSTR